MALANSTQTRAKWSKFDVKSQPDSSESDKDTEPEEKGGIVVTRGGQSTNELDGMPIIAL